MRSNFLLFLSLCLFIFMARFLTVEESTRWAVSAADVAGAVEAETAEAGAEAEAHTG